MNKETILALQHILKTQHQFFGTMTGEWDSTTANSYQSWALAHNVPTNMARLQPINLDAMEPTLSKLVTDYMAAQSLVGSFPTKTEKVVADTVTGTSVTTEVPAPVTKPAGDPATATTNATTEVKPDPKLELCKNNGKRG